MECDLNPCHPVENLKKKYFVLHLPLQISLPILKLARLGIRMGRSRAGLIHEGDASGTVTPSELHGGWSQGWGGE